jgi:RadC-like JAB domain
MSAVRNAFQINTHNWPTAAVAVAHAFLHECDGGLISMAYRLKTFRVQFVAEPVEFPAGSPCRSSEGCRTSSAINLSNPRRRQRAFSFARDEQQEPSQWVQGRVNRKPYRVASHPREVWRTALYLCAAAVVFVHNHPSGDPAPSQEDQEITRRLKETGDMLGIRVLDHVVLGDGRFFSFSDRGLL